LANKVQEERREVQDELSFLVGEEQAAKKKAAEVAKNIKVEVKTTPTVVDVYEHKTYTTNEPIITEMHVEHDDKSLVSNIIDGVKSLF
jgi:aconitase A